jgi:hypothetical protein
MLPPVRDEDIDWAERTLGDGIEFDDEAQEFIRVLDSLHLVACPGSGKTTALIAKLLILSQHLPLSGNRGICILTHTNVAVEQIRTRVGTLGQCLFSYPNFCGTFQSFVGKFLGHPAYVETFGYRVARVDNEVATRELLNGNPRALQAAQAYLDHKRLTLEGLRFNQDLEVVKYGEAEPFVGTDTPTYRTVFSMKMAVLRAGVLFYDDVYVFAERHLARHPEIVEVFPKRFPYVFVDEMQDTDERQMAILDRLFANDDTALQCVGDPNQAIYHQSAVGEGCVWQPPAESPQLSTSRRFGSSIAAVVSNLSVVSPVSVVGGANNGNIKPYLIVFADSRIEDVIPAFAKLITDHRLHELPNNRGFKAVGWVAKEHESKHTVPDYWPQFDVTRNRRQSSYVTLRGNLHSASLSDDFGSPKAFRSALLAGVVGLLKAGNAETDTGRRFTKTSLLAHLREHDEGALITLERQSAAWCLRWNVGEDVTDEVSEFFADWLPASFDIDVNDEDVVDYLTEDEEAAPADPADGTANGYVLDGGIIDVSSVHAVKGETHTATLMLETFYYGYDMHRILPNLKGQAATGREAKRVKESLKIALVACSRPTHLLAAAIHADTLGFCNARKHVTDADLTELVELWEIVDLR